MQRTARQFEPAAQFEQTAAEIGEVMFELNAKFERLEWLREKTLAEFRALRDAADTFEVFTEAEAADQLKVGERIFADLRRDNKIPCFYIGNKPRYTRRHLEEITVILESRPRGKSALKIAA